MGKDFNNLPLNKLVPYGEQDLCVIWSNKFGIVLHGITDERDRLLHIKEYMEKASVFGKEPFSERLEKFANIIPTRLERFFDTKKVDYIFYDKEEQTHLKKLFKNGKYFCRVSILKNDGSDVYKEVKASELNTLDARACLTMLSKLGVKTILPARIGYDQEKAYEEKIKKFNEHRRKMYQKKDNPMEYLFKRYPKLSSFDTKSDIKKYHKRLCIKYHPDKGGDQDMMAMINTDFDFVFQSSWFKSKK